jgi:hypothetical protein
VSDRPVRKLSVSEFIRESKPDWEHVRYREKRTSTKPFSGAPVVTMENAESFTDQLDHIDKQILGLEEKEAWHGEETRLVDDD